MTRTALDDPRFYLNRHLEWLEFNRRVLEEACDIGNPLLERVKFLAITANNLDEFVEVRVASFLQRIEHGSRQISPDGLTVEQELEKVSADMHVMVRDQYKCWNEELLPALAKVGIRVLPASQLEGKAAQAAKTFFERRVSPMLTPVTVDPSHPFPHVLNKALCIAFLLRRRRNGNGKPYFGVLTVPRALPRLLRVPATDGGIHYVALQEIVSAYAAKLYRGYEILASAPFRITRNSNLYLEEEEARSLLDAVDAQVSQRRKGDAVRLEIAADAHPDIINRLVSTFELDESLVFRAQGPVNLQRLFHLYEETPRPDLKYPPFAPRQVRVGHDADSMFEAIRRQAHLLHHPYESYDAVVNFLQTAAHDPRVLSIKQTLYRTNSLVGLKTHAKLMLIVRQDPDGKIRRYAHLGTGNYNPSTARYYSDLSLLTNDESITSAVHDVFNFLTAYAEQPNYKPLLLAPRDMAKSCLELIDREARHARRGRPARIIAKINAVIDPPIIQALYRASSAGVEIDLIVRGQCGLVPGLRGVSSRVRVRSIVGRFLEHSRIFYFENGGKPEVYLGSADWMPRNLYERVEVLFPLKDPQHCERVCNEILSSYLADTRKARILDSDGAYSRPRAVRNGHGFSAQEHFMRLAGGDGDSAHIPALRKQSVVYTPTTMISPTGGAPEEESSLDSSNATV
jgi:polyphosphate kinase